MNIILNTNGFEDFKRLARGVEAEFDDPLVAETRPKPTLEDIEVLDRKKRIRLIEILVEKRFEIVVRFDDGYETLETARQLEMQPWQRLKYGIFDSVWGGLCDTRVGSIWISTLDDLSKTRLKGAGGRKAKDAQEQYWLNELNCGQGMTAKQVSRELENAGLGTVSDRTVRRWREKQRPQ